MVSLSGESFRFVLVGALPLTDLDLAPALAPRGDRLSGFRRNVDPSCVIPYCGILVIRPPIGIRGPLIALPFSSLGLVMA